MSLDVVAQDTRVAPAPRPRRRALVAVLAVLALAWVVWQAWPRTSGLPLDPDNAEPGGARAVAEVLRHQGVRVDVVRDRAGLRDAALDDRTTLVVVSGPTLTRDGLMAVGDEMRRVGGVAAVGLPDDGLVELDLPARRTGSTELDAEPGCTSSLVSGLGRIEPVDRGYELTGDASGAEQCYATGEGHALLRLPRTEDRPSVDLLAPSELLSNDTITTQDDAAVALRLLGQRPHVVWFAPDGRDLAAGDSGVEARLSPPWWLPLLLLLGGAVLLTAWWRGRRLGPLAEEPLPVLVPAAETTVARGRLYRQAGRRGADGRSHAAGVLRSATRRRLAERLGLPRDATTDALVARLSTVVPRRADDIRELLAGSDPADDAALVALATDLTRLEKEVSHP